MDQTAPPNQPQNPWGYRQAQQYSLREKPRNNKILITAILALITVVIIAITTVLFFSAQDAVEISQTQKFSGELSEEELLLQAQWESCLTSPLASQDAQYVNDLCYLYVLDTDVFESDCALIQTTQLRDSCFRKVAIQIETPELCDAISTADNRVSCYSVIAQNTQDQSVCQTLPTDSEITQCQTLSSTPQDISIDCITVDVAVTSCQKNEDNTYDVTIERNEGPGTFRGVSILFEAENGNTAVHRVYVILEEGQSYTFTNVPTGDLIPQTADIGPITADVSKPKLFCPPTQTPVTCSA